MKTTRVNLKDSNVVLKMNITKSEQIILNALWKDSPLTVGQIIERTQANNDWHENTIKTMLLRLTKKQAVIRFKDGKRFFYSPAVSKNKILTEESEGFLSRFFDGKMAPFLAHFAQNKNLSKQELEEIETILNKLKSDD